MNDLVESLVGHWAASPLPRRASLVAPHNRVAALSPTHFITSLTMMTSYRLEGASHHAPNQ